MQDFIVEEALVAVDSVSSSQVPIASLLVVKDGVGKAKGPLILRAALK